jgi:membrane protein
MKWNFQKFFTPAYWTSIFSKGHPIHASFVKAARISFAAVRGFTNDDCSSKASALTFYSLLSIVPLLAVAFGIAKGFGFERHLEAELTEKFMDQRDFVQKLIGFSQQALKTAQGGVIAGVGLAALFWTVIKLLGSIENSFNEIWKVKRSRALARKFSDYLAVIFFCPLFFAASSSISVFVMTELIQLTKQQGMWETLSPLILISFHIFPVILSWFLFTAIYYIMPNVKVPFSYAFLAGIIAGTIYQIVQWIYFRFQIGLSSYGAIYGSFAALPLFLVWLNTSWYIVLFGAEIAYHAENDRAQGTLYRATRQYRADGRVLGLVVMQQCIRAFCNAQVPPTEYLLSERTGVPVLSIRMILHQLLAAGLLVEVTWKNGFSGYYQPGRNLKRITIKSVCDALDTSRQEQFVMVHDAEVDEYVKILSEFDNVLDNAQINKPLDSTMKTLEDRTETNSSI